MNNKGQKLNDELKLQRFFERNNYSEQQVLSFLNLYKQKKEKEIALLEENFELRGPIAYNVNTEFETMLDQFTTKTFSKEPIIGSVPVGNGTFMRRNLRKKFVKEHTLYKLDLEAKSISQCSWEEGDK